MTSRNQQVLDFIREFNAKHRYSPSVREIQQGCGFASASTAAYWLAKLVDEGMLEMVPGKARTAVLTAKGQDVL